MKFIVSQTPFPIMERGSEKQQFYLLWSYSRCLVNLNKPFKD